MKLRKYLKNVNNGESSNKKACNHQTAAWTLNSCSADNATKRSAAEKRSPPLQLAGHVAWKEVHKTPVAMATRR